MKIHIWLKNSAAGFVKAKFGEKWLSEAKLKAQNEASKIQS